MLLFIMLNALLLRLNSQDVKRLMFLPCCFDLNKKEVLDDREPCNFDGS